MAIDPELLNLVRSLGIGPIDPDRLRRTQSLMNGMATGNAIEENFRRAVAENAARGVTPDTPTIGPSTQPNWFERVMGHQGPLSVQRQARREVEDQIPYQTPESIQRRYDAAARDPALGYIFGGVDPLERPLVPLDFTDAGDALAFMDAAQHFRRGQVGAGLFDAAIGGLGVMLPFGSIRPLIKAANAPRGVTAVYELPTGIVRKMAGIPDDSRWRRTERLLNMSNSIAERGIDSPLLIDLSSDGTSGIKDGVKRLLSAEHLGMETVPVTFRVGANRHLRGELATPEQLWEWVDMAEDAQRPGRQAVLEFIQRKPDDIETADAQSAWRTARTIREMSQGRGIVRGSRLGGTWHSRALQAIDEAEQEVATGSQWLAHLRKNPDPVTKQARGGSTRELEKTKLTEFLEDNPDLPLTKDDLRVLWRENMGEVTMSEAVYGSRHFREKFQTDFYNARDDYDWYWRLTKTYQRDLALADSPETFDLLRASRVRDLEEHAAKLNAKIESVARAYARIGMKEQADAVRRFKVDPSADILADPAEKLPDFGEAIQHLLEPSSVTNQDAYSGYTFRNMGAPFSADQGSPAYVADQSDIDAAFAGLGLDRYWTPETQATHVFRSNTATDLGEGRHYYDPNYAGHLRTSLDVVDGNLPTLHVDELQSDLFQPDFRRKFRAFQNELLEEAERAWREDPSIMPELRAELMDAGISEEGAYATFRGLHSQEELMKLGLRHLPEERRAEILAEVNAEAADPEMMKEMQTGLEEIRQAGFRRQEPYEYAAGEVQAAGGLRDQGGRRANGSALTDLLRRAFLDPETVPATFRAALDDVRALFRLDPDRIRKTEKHGFELEELLSGAKKIGGGDQRLHSLMDVALDDLTQFFDARDAHNAQPIFAFNRLVEGVQLAFSAPASSPISRNLEQFPRWVFDDMWDAMLRTFGEPGPTADLGLENKTLQRYFYPRQRNGALQSADDAYEDLNEIFQNFRSQSRLNKNSWKGAFTSDHPTASLSWPDIMDAVFNHLTDDDVVRLAHEIHGPEAGSLMSRLLEAKTDALVADDLIRDLERMSSRRASLAHEPTDEWVKFGLRRAVQAAAASGVPRVSITSGDMMTMGVDSYRPSGMRYFYDPDGKIVRKGLEAVAKELGLPKSAVRTARRTNMPTPTFEQIVTAATPKKDIPEWQAVYNERRNTLEDLMRMDRSEVAELMGREIDNYKDELLARLEIYKDKVADQYRSLDEGNPLDRLPFTRPGGAMDEEFKAIEKWIHDNFDEQGRFIPQEELVLELGEDLMRRLQSGETSTRLLGIAPLLGATAAGAAARSALGYSRRDGGES